MAIAEFRSHGLALPDADRRPRTDAAALAAKILYASEFLALRAVRCEFANGCLTLRGVVASFHLKQVAQTLVRDLPGVARIVNRLEVVGAG